MPTCTLGHFSEIFIKLYQFTYTLWAENGWRTCWCADINSNKLPIGSTNLVQSWSLSLKIVWWMNNYCKMGVPQLFLGVLGVSGPPLYVCCSRFVYYQYFQNPQSMKFLHILPIICPILYYILHNITFKYAQVLFDIYAWTHKHGYISWSLTDKKAIEADLESLII